MSNLYRNHFDGTEDLDAYLDIYTLHLFAMTTEALHSKAEIIHELAYRDYQIQLLKAELSDAELSPDDNSDTVPMPRELTDEQAIKAHLVEYQWTPAPEHITRIKAVYAKCVQALHPERGDSE